MSDLFELEVILRGPARTLTNSYGDREERDVLARLEVPLDGATGWLIYQRAVNDAVGPKAEILFKETA